MKKIVTEYVYPPIPIRKFDWRAWFEDEPEGLIGWGSTEKLAIKDLESLNQDY